MPVSRKPRNKDIQKRTNFAQNWGVKEVECRIVTYIVTNLRNQSSEEENHANC